MLKIKHEKYKIALICVIIHLILSNDFCFSTPSLRLQYMIMILLIFLPKKICTRNEKGKVKKTPRLTCAHFLRTISNTFIYTCERFFFQDFELVQSEYQYLEIVMPARTKFFSFLVISWFIC